MDHQIFFSDVNYSIILKPKFSLSQQRRLSEPVLLREVSMRSSQCVQTFSRQHEIKELEPKHFASVDLFSKTLKLISEQFEVQQFLPFLVQTLDSSCYARE